MVATTGFAPADERDGQRSFYGQEIEWAPCLTPEELAEAEPSEGDPDWTSRLECGTVTVPVDHGDTWGETIEMAVVRHPAQGTAEQYRGSLVFNFGGPGSAGVEQFRAGPLALSRQTRDAFDLVSFDPRGVGESAGFTCPAWEVVKRPLEAVRGTAPEDVTEGRIRDLERAAMRYARSCVDEVGEGFLANMGTVSVVRDLDLLRDALGEDRLSYVGYSYGTRVGALYAEMFAENTRALALDGAMQIERDVIADAVEQSEGAQTAWEAFVAYCLEEAPECPFTGAEEAPAEAEAILAGLDADPIVFDGEAVGRHQMLGLLRDSLRSERQWESDARLLARIAAGDTGDEFVQAYLSRFADGPDEAPGATESAFTAVQCADHVRPTDPRDYQEGARRAAELSPFFGGDEVWSYLPCAYWPDTELAPTGVSAPMAPPILVIGTLGDPATPYVWARELAGQLASATLFTYEGGGHTAYGNRRACVDGVVDAYLLDGEVPSEGSSCPGEL
ncbi:alpha/beta hydrolase [Nocardiopsis ganjiahuensis]|uniref:alpha/beta hydrolase n=1 Tax=Nocardiopsis ganjiahuensis TaxID=239984 RepID=UPI000686EA43|nr:alpha/beta hydrolase [Nocardiopsis ganjiahuensis]